MSQRRAINITIGALTTYLTSLTMKICHEQRNITDYRIIQNRCYFFNTVIGIYHEI